MPASTVACLSDASCNGAGAAGVIAAPAIPDSVETPASCAGTASMAFALRCRAKATTGCHCAGLADASALCVGRTMEMSPEQSRCFFISASNAFKRAALGRRSRLLSVILNNRRPLLPSVAKVIRKFGKNPAPVRRDGVSLFRYNRFEGHGRASASEHMFLLCSQRLVNPQTGASSVITTADPML